MEAIIMKFIGVLIVDLVIFGAVSAISCAVKTLKFFYIGFGVLVAAVFGSILYLGFSFHDMGYWPVWFLVVAAIIAMVQVIWEYFFVRIPADPPSIGVLTVWGERKIVFGRDVHDVERPMTVEYCKEGLHLYCPYFPFFIDYNRVDVIKRNKEFEIIVWCKRKEDPNKPDQSQMGAQMKVTGSYTWSPDPSRLYQFLQTGEDRGVNQIFPDVIEEETREVAQVNYWEDFLALQQEVTNRIIRRVTDEEDGRAIVNGSSDVQEMGTLLYRLNVKSIDPVDEELKKSVTAFSREERERQAEIHEMKTETAQALVLVKQVEKAGKEMSIQDAYALIKRYKLAREGKMDAKHFSFEGLDSIVPILEKVFAKKS